MGRIIKIAADTYMLDHLDALSAVTRESCTNRVIGGAVALTAEAMEKFAAGYAIQVIEQSVKRDKFEAPFYPPHALLEIRRRPLAPAPANRSMTLAIDSVTADRLDSIARMLGTDNTQDALHFSMMFAHHVADSLQKPGRHRLLGYTCIADSRYGYVAKTPYDRTIRTQFNRVIEGFQDWWRGTPPQNPPGCTMREIGLSP